MTEPLVGWHHGRAMRLDEIADHNKRWAIIEPEARLTVEHLGYGSLAADMLNEIDRLRFLLDEGRRAYELKETP